jgi:hypothetical protein
MTNPLLKAAGIAPDTPGHSAERALFDAALECVEILRDAYRYEVRICCESLTYRPHAGNCPVAAFDRAAELFEEKD